MINISETDTDLDWVYNGHMHEKLLNLLSNAAFDGMVKQNYERQISDFENMDKESYEKIVFILYSNQLDRVTHGENYNMGDIKRHLKKLK